MFIRSIRNGDDPEADSADKIDDLGLLLAFVAVVVIWGVALLLT